jgi:hypothetical protein
VPLSSPWHHDVTRVLLPQASGDPWPLDTNRSPCGHLTSTAISYSKPPPPVRQLLCRRRDLATSAPCDRLHQATAVPWTLDVSSNLTPVWCRHVAIDDQSASPSIAAPRSASRADDALSGAVTWPPDIDGNLLLLPSPLLACCFSVRRRLSGAVAVATRHQRQSVPPALTGDLLLGQAVYKARKSQVSDDMQRKLNPTFMKCRCSNYYLLSTNFFYAYRTHLG